MHRSEKLDAGSFFYGLDSYNIETEHMHYSPPPLVGRCRLTLSNPS